MTHIGLLKTLACIFSPSGNEDKMIKYLVKFCKRVPNTKITKDKFGNLYVTRGIAETFPCIVSHCDQVSNVYHDKDFTCLETNGVLFGFSPSKYRMNNCGWDDKAGIAIALIALQQTQEIKIAFFRQEEVGTIGSENANMDFFKNVRFVVEPDRRGNMDIISSIGCSEICSTDFLNATNYINYGYIENDGMLTDVLALKENGLDVSCINISCGYYNHHSNEECLNYKDWEKCLMFVLNIVESCVEVYPHEFEDKPYYNSFSFGGYYDSFSSQYLDFIFDIQYSAGIDFKNLSLNDVKKFADDYGYSLSKDEIERAYHSIKNLYL